MWSRPARRGGPASAAPYEPSMQAISLSSCLYLKLWAAELGNVANSSYTVDGFRCGTGGMGWFKVARGYFSVL